MVSRPSGIAEGREGSGEGQVEGHDGGRKQVRRSRVREFTQCVTPITQTAYVYFTALLADQNSAEYIIGAYSEYNSTYFVTIA